MNPSINLDLNQLPVGRALGLHCDTASDTFQFMVVPTNRPPTKRAVLSTVSSLYDLLGFLGPFLLPVKVILQELWRIAVQWDDPIPEPLLTRWNKWVREKGSLKANDLVPIVDEKSPRVRWLLGRILMIFPGYDQRV